MASKFKQVELTREELQITIKALDGFSDPYATDREKVAQADLQNVLRVTLGELIKEQDSHGAR